MFILSVADSEFDITNAWRVWLPERSSFPAVLAGHQGALNFRRDE